jgi:alkylhydroperoxidase family enzyme
MTSPSQPRLPPLPEKGRTARQQEVIDDLVVGPVVNIYTTLARHPDAAAAMVNLGRTLRGGRLPARHREVLILRTGWNNRCVYEFAQHRRIALSVGMSLDDVRRIQQGPDASGWDPFEALLCRAADELHHSQELSDETWSSLAARYGEEELIEAVMIIGYYHLVSFALNAFRVPLEDGVEAFVDD